MGGSDIVAAAPGGHSIEVLVPMSRAHAPPGSRARVSPEIPSMCISSLVLLLLLASAGLHATWNLLVKRGEDTLIATWLTAIVAPVVLWPLLLFTGLPPPPAWPMLLASGTVHAAYNVTLATAYKHGDLSVVYPVARGLAPLLVGMGAPLILGESLSPAAMVAIVLVGGGVAWLGLSARRTRAIQSPGVWRDPIRV